MSRSPFLSESTQVRTWQVRAMLLVLSMSLLLCLPSSHDFIRTTWSLPIVFSVRAALGKAPEVSPDLKIYVFDDVTVADLGSDDLNIEEWGRLIQLFDEQKPRVILIDKMFATPRGSAEDLCA